MDLSMTLEDIFLFAFGLVAVGGSLVMLFAKNPITVALGLLSVLLATGCTYGLMGEHMVATLQIVVYAGAIMVLFVFSIMLLNLNNLKFDLAWPRVLFWASVAGLAAFFALICINVLYFFQSKMAQHQWGEFTPEKVSELGGNARVLSQALFSQNYFSFELVSIPLLIALVGAVVLAKRKLN
ncbi:MAG: NADH-quinone oxidoreductase subunit J [Bacteriovoracaceae bacterium]|nr:NADH-quinone oxidoreductase subunit J [Bacteriovoracaceae bacterium]